MTADLITETYADIMRFTQPSNNPHSGHADGLWNKVHRCIRVYNECILNGIFIEELPESTCHGIRIYWILKKSAAVYHLLRHPTSFL